MKTIAFHSYIGNTAGSRLVVEAARQLAVTGKRVAVADFVLEAPSLHYQIGATPLNPASGLVDFLASRIQAVETGKISFIKDYALSIPTNTNTITFIPAGAAPSNAYWEALATFQRGLVIYKDFSLLEQLLEIKYEIEDDLGAQYLLLDLPSGVTAMAGILKTLVADMTVNLTSTNAQSIDGTREILAACNTAPRLPDAQDLELLPLFTDQDLICRASNALMDSINYPLVLDGEKPFVLNADNRRLIDRIGQ